MNGNSFKGTIPTEITLLTKLSYLRMAGNKFQGLIPNHTATNTDVIPGTILVQSTPFPTFSPVFYPTYNDDNSDGINYVGLYVFGASMGVVGIMAVCLGVYAVFYGTGAGSVQNPINRNGLSSNNPRLSNVASVLEERPEVVQESEPRLAIEEVKFEQQQELPVARTVQIETAKAL
jgi:hypothetical protein